MANINRLIEPGIGYIELDVFDATHESHMDLVYRSILEFSLILGNESPIFEYSIDTNSIKKVIQYSIIYESVSEKLKSFHSIIKCKYGVINYGDPNIINKVRDIKINKILNV